MITVVAGPSRTTAPDARWAGRGRFGDGLGADFAGGWPAGYRAVFGVVFAVVAVSSAWTASRSDAT